MTIRDTAAALARALVGGEQGRRIDDPIVQAVTEGRIPRDRYSSCADHPHALRYQLGLRARVNRREAGSYQAGTRTMAWLCERGRVGARLGHPCAVVPRATTRLDPGDTVILDVGHADRTHTCIVLEHGAKELVTADYGQHPFLGQRPEHIACRVVRRPLTVRSGRIWAGDRPIDSVLPLEAELAWAEREGTLRPAKTLEEWLAAHGTPAPKMATTARPTLRRGSGYLVTEEASAVRVLQALLGGLVVDGLVVDGQFGPRTESAVRAYQFSHDLVVDGIVGPQTWAALEGS